MMLLRIVGELNTKMPPPPTTTGDTGAWPAPPVIVNPSRIVAGVCPLANVTTEHLFAVELFAQQFALVQFRVGPVIVVSPAPPCEVELTNGFIRIASLYVPGSTDTVSFATATQIASWILQYGLAIVPEPVCGQVLSST